MTRYRHRRDAVFAACIALLLGAAGCAAVLPGSDGDVVVSNSDTTAPNGTVTADEQTDVTGFTPVANASESASGRTDASVPPPTDRYVSDP